MAYNDTDAAADGGIVINPHSDWGKELVKWEQHATYFVGRGQNPGNPYVFRPYPKMLYKVQPHPSGQVKCMDVPPNSAFYEDPRRYEQACLLVENFNKSCQRIVNSEDEQAKAEREGWRDHPDRALAAAELLHQDMANAAAMRAHSDTRMSAKAQAEATLADDATSDHVADVPAPKRKPRGRPKKERAHA